MKAGRLDAFLSVSGRRCAIMYSDLLQCYEDVLVGRRSVLPRRLFLYDDSLPHAKEKQALEVIRFAIKVHLGWTPAQAVAHFTLEVAHLLKLDQVLRYIVYPLEFKDDMRYVLHLLWPRLVPLPVYDQVLKLYHDVQAKKRSFPPEWMEGMEGRMHAEICLQDAIVQNLPAVDDVQKLYKMFSCSEGRAFLKHMKLWQACCAQFDTPVQYLHLSLPDSQKDLYWYAYYSYKYLESGKPVKRKTG